MVWRLGAFYSVYGREPLCVPSPTLDLKFSESIAYCTSGKLFLILCLVDVIICVTVFMSIKIIFSQ